MANHVAQPCSPVPEKRILFTGIQAPAWSFGLEFDYVNMKSSKAKTCLNKHRTTLYDSGTIRDRQKRGTVATVPYIILRVPLCPVWLKNNQTLSYFCPYLFLNTNSSNGLRGTSRGVTAGYPKGMSSTTTCPSGVPRISPHLA